MICAECGLVWDMNDPDRPECAAETPIPVPAFPVRHTDGGRWGSQLASYALPPELPVEIAVAMLEHLERAAFSATTNRTGPLATCAMQEAYGLMRERLTK